MLQFSCSTYIFKVANRKRCSEYFSRFLCLYCRFKSKFVYRFTGYLANDSAKPCFGASSKRRGSVLLRLNKRYNLCMGNPSLYQAVSYMCNSV